LANDARAWREFGLRFDRMIERCITKVTRAFSSRVTLEDVREIHAQFALSLLANDRHKLRTFDRSRGARFSSFIAMLATNAAYDHLRMVRREPQKTELAEALEIPALESDPFEDACERECAGIAARMMNDFTERDRLFAILYFVEGLEPSAIAERMKISVGTVYSKKHKIQLKLEALAEEVAA